MSTTLDAGRRPRMDPRIARRRVEVRREEGRRRLRILVGCASAFAVVCLLVGSLWTPLFKVRHVRVGITPAGGHAGTPGAAQVTVQQILVAAGLAKQRLMIDVSGSATARRLDSVPVLGAAHVSVDWPGTVKISVAVRTPVAQVQTTQVQTTQAATQAAAGQQGGGAARWATVDATGRVLSVSGTAFPGLPVIDGAGAVPAPGGWLPATAGPSAPVAGAQAPRAAGGSALVDMNAQSDSTQLPTGLSAALAIAAALPPDIEGDVHSISLGTGAHPSLTMSVLPKRVAAGSIKVVLGDGSQLSSKLTALETLLTQADLGGVGQIDLTVPDRPAVLAARQ